MADVDPSPERVNINGSRQFAGSGREVDYFVAVVCTDRGQHKRVVLTTARRELDGTHGMNHALEHFAPPDRKARPGSLMGRDSYIFLCPKCRRTPQLQRDRWWKLVDDMARAGIFELDLSLLPL